LNLNIYIYLIEKVSNLSPLPCEFSYRLRRAISWISDWDQRTDIGTLIHSQSQESTSIARADVSPENHSGFDIQDSGCKDLFISATTRGTLHLNK